MSGGETERANGVRDAIRRVWEKTRHTTRERAATLERAATAQLKGELDNELRSTACGEAHRLAGTLGTFGFADASALAREAEAILEGTEPLGEGAEYRLSQVAIDLLQILDKAGDTLPQDRVPPIVPTSPEESSVAAPTPTSAPGVPVRRPRVISVDDDETMRALVASALAVHGIDVTSVADSRDAVEMVIATRPDMVITDLDMPHLDGLALCRELRAHEATRDIPILFLTSYDSRGTLSTLFEAGADDHLAKPASPDEIAARVRNRLARSGFSRRVTAPSPQTRPSSPRDRALGSAAGAASVDVALVDDDSILTDLLCHSMEARGYTSLVIGSGLEAVELLGGRHPARTARVIVLDVSLPGLDGLAVLRALVRDGVTPRTPVIMLTARTLESEVVEALDLGAFDHVAKPFSIPVFLQRVRRAMDASAL